jgi:hypothetical protein
VNGYGSLTICDTLVTLHVTDLTVGVNSAGIGVATGILVLNGGAVVNATDVERFSLAIGGSGASSALVRLAGNSTLNLGSAAAPADLVIGNNYSSWVYPGGNHVGVLDASNAAASVNLVLDELYVGASSGNGAATGILRWNQSEVIDANLIYFGVGGGATGKLEMSAGDQMVLGSAADPIGFLEIGTQNGVAELDFSLTDPFFTAYLGGLDIGHGWTGAASGLLKLGTGFLAHRPILHGLPGWFGHRPRLDRGGQRAAQTRWQLDTDGGQRRRAGRCHHRPEYRRLV